MTDPIMELAERLEALWQEMDELEKTDGSCAIEDVAVAHEIFAIEDRCSTHQATSGKGAVLQLQLLGCLLNRIHVEASMGMTAKREDAEQADRLLYSAVVALEREFAIDRSGSLARRYFPEYLNPFVPKEKRQAA